MPGPVFLDGDRVALRTLEREDLEFLQRSRNEPAIRRGLTFSTPATADDVETFYEEVVSGDDNVNLVVCLDGERAGVVTLFDLTRHSAELAYWVVPEARGEGYAGEAAELLVGHAFDSIGLHRLQAKALEHNDASRRLLERLGFREEGRAREVVRQDGAFVDHVRYGLLAREFSR